MNKITAIIVDDEEGAGDVLQNLLLRFCPEIELIGRCINVPDAVALIKEKQPQLLFLDIEMPKYAGYEIVNFFERIDFQIIFTTAYEHYALRAFELAAIDYLLKPIDIERLKTAVLRASKQIDLQQNNERMQVLSQTLQTQTVKNIVVSEKGQQHVIAIENIIAIEAQEAYCTIHCAERKYIVSKNLKHFENIFADNPLFLRVHKSWIIAKAHIRHYSKTDGNIELSQNIKAKLSKYKKTEFEEALKS